MNEFEPVSIGQIDRLVDGELSRDERRAVLMALDHERDGWRQLALAFLESQALRDSLSGRSKATAAPINIALVGVTRPAMRSRWSSSSIVAVVASAALMFGLGRLSTSSIQQASHETAPSAPATYQPSMTSPVEDPQNEVLVADAGSSVQQQQTLRLELGDGQGGATQAVEVPMVESTGIRPEDLLAGPSVIPDSVQRALLRSGKRVYEQRQLYEVTLEDGRHGVMPISNVVVEKAGWDVYQ
ncbi:MAG: hypothetical protein JWP89_1446 [Schlesneria sp.]|nr:hypothetical protein [Schlesneria sp.]